MDDKNLNSAILKNLNNKQLEAVTSISGSILVIAGAGSGKTAVLTRRTAYLISKQVVPGSILCLTFTNKASKEMNTRVDKLLSEVEINLPKNLPWVNDYINRPLLSTFHSLGVKILREFYNYVELKKDFTILDSDDQKKIIKDILKARNIDIKNLNPNQVGYFISLCKQELLNASNSRSLKTDFLPIFHQIYKDYEIQLNKLNSVDFDDLILLPYLILSQNEEVLKIFQNRFDHIMIDEFQDTNSAQFELIKLLMPLERLKNDNTASLFVVGDDAQSIYSFRGSKIELILNFHQIYPNCKEIILNQNYRSTQAILDLAEKIISQNPNQKKKDLFTDNQSDVKVSYYLARDEKDEAEYILKKIWQIYTSNIQEKSINHSINSKNNNFEEIVFLEKEEEDYTNFKLQTEDPIGKMFEVYLELDENTALNDFDRYNTNNWKLPSYDWQKVGENLNNCVVLYRTHAQSRSLEEVFLKYQLPYKLVSGTRFLDRKEVKDVISILKYAFNWQDTVSLSRFLPLITTGTGPKTLQKIIDFIETGESTAKNKILENFIDIRDLILNSKNNHSKIIDFTEELLNITGYLNYLKRVYPNKEEYLSRLENIGEIYSLMLPFENLDQESKNNNSILDFKLQMFLENIVLMSNQDEDSSDKKPKVSLMSLHQSKGLEFENVFLVGVEDGLLPHQNSLFSDNGIDEEVRLAYVGVTRAKKYLHLISADSRVYYGQIKTNPISRIFRPFLDKYTVRERN